MGPPTELTLEMTKSRYTPLVVSAEILAPRVAKYSGKTLNIMDKQYLNKPMRKTTRKVDQADFWLQTNFQMLKH